MAGWIVFGYVASVIWTFGVLNADSRAYCEELAINHPGLFRGKRLKRSRREWLAYAIAVSLIPVVNVVVSTLATGFFMEGWTLKVGPFTRES